MTFDRSFNTNVKGPYFLLQELLPVFANPAKGLSWRGYMEDMGNDPVRDNGVNCAHPVPNSQDQTQSASATDQYASRHNPFIYFHSLLDSGDCARNDGISAR